MLKHKRIPKLYLLFLLICLHAVTVAQNTRQNKGRGKITGKVLDSATAKPLEYATITLLVASEKKPVNGAVTSSEGKFEITGIAEGSYQVLVEFLGFKPHTISNVVISTKKQEIDLPAISLSGKGATLETVTVTAPQGLIDNKIDKIVFNAEKDLTSQGGVATDILKKVPQVSVDVDGNVELSGSSSIRFLINGKPSSAFGSNIADVLQSIPASQIKSIEVITNPGAKYDAQGLGGIINIILKQNNARGINGSLSLSAGTRMENGSFNISARGGNFGVHAFISGNERLKANTPSMSDRLSADTGSKTNTLFHQDGNYAFYRHGFQSGLGFDWTLHKKNSFSGTIGYDNFGNNGNGIINQMQTVSDMSGAGTILSQILSLNHTDNQFRNHNIDASLNYKRTFDKEDQELEISINSSYGSTNGSVHNYQSLVPLDSLFYGTNSNNPGKDHETELQINYTQPLNKDVLLGMGSKWVSRDVQSNSDIFTFQPVPKDYLYNNSLSNYLDYKQNVYAFYSEISFPVAKLLEAKIGGRYERTEINSFFSNAQKQASTPGYNTFVPSIFFIRKLNDKQTLKLSYSKRIERPDYRDLNPFINTSDPKNLSTGNPYLLPEIGNRFELSYTYNMDKAGSLMITAFYRTSNHDIQPYIVYYPTLRVGDSVYTNVAVSTSQNIGLEKNTGFNVFADLHLSTKLNFRTNLFFFKRNTINSIDPGFNSHSFNYRFNMNASYQFSKELSAEFFGNFNSARHEVQGKYPSFTSYSMAIRKQIWNKKGSLALTATNIFNKYVNQRTEVFGPQFSVNSLRQVPFRSIGINFTWKFGKLEFKKEKEENNSNLNPPND